MYVFPRNLRYILHMTGTCIAHVKPRYFHTGNILELLSFFHIMTASDVTFFLPSKIVVSLSNVHHAYHSHFHVVSGHIHCDAA